MADKPEKPDYGDTLEAQMIADYVTEGMTLIDACRTMDIPRNTIYQRIADNPKFAAMMETAREKGYDAIANECLAIADETARDTEMGKFGPKPNKEWMARSRLRVETRLKLLAKWHPKKYGEKLQVESVNKNVEIPITDDPAAAQRAYEDLMKG